MDQLKEALAQAQKHHFWIICGLVVVVGFISWYIAKAGLDDETTQRANEIKSKQSEIQQVASVMDPPNQNFLNGMDTLNREFAEKIKVSWKIRYKQQEALFQWPSSFPQGFIDAVTPLRPIEAIPFPTPPEKEIYVNHRDVYRNFIAAELPKLATVIGSKWHVDAEGAASSPSGGLYGASPGGFGGGERGGGGFGGGLASPGAAAVDKSVVYWPEDSQKELVTTHFGFASRGTPSTLEVLYAQEDLWVLQALMQIIKKTNGSADASYDATVKEIHSIQIGKTVKGRMGKVTQVKEKAKAGGPGGPGDGSGAMGNPAAMSTPSVPPSGGPGGTQAQKTAEEDPAFGRYVDVDYNPLAPATIRGAATSNDPKTAIYAVAKRMPVRMRLLIDQRHLSQLVAECGNFQLPVEVRQIRINGQENLSSDGMGHQSGYDSGSSSGGGGGNVRLSKRPSGGGLGSPDGKNDAPPNEVIVEVYGIVYIFNPVNDQVLGTSSAVPGAAIPGTQTPPATPAVPVTAPTAGVVPVANPAG